MLILRSQFQNFGFQCGNDRGFFITITSGLIECQAELLQCIHHGCPSTVFSIRPHLIIETTDHGHFVFRINGINNLGEIDADFLFQLLNVIVDIFDRPIQFLVLVVEFGNFRKFAARLVVEHVSRDAEDDRQKREQDQKVMDGSWFVGSGSHGFPLGDNRMMCKE